MAGVSQKNGLLCTALGAITWGINGSVTQFLFMHYTVNAAWLTAIRMILAGIILIITVWPTHRQQFRLLFSDSHDVFRVCLFAIFGLLWSQYSYLSAIKYSNSGTATVLQTLSIVLMAIYIAFRHRALPVPREMISIVLAVSGVFLIATNGSMSSLVISPLGLFWGLMAAVGAVTYPLLSHDLAWRWHASVVNGPSMLIGGLALLFVFQLWQYTPALDVIGWLAVAFIIIVGTAISFTLFIRGISEIGPMKGTLIATLEPVVATAASVLWLGTVFHPTELIGFVFILTTVFLLVLRRHS